MSPVTSPETARLVATIDHSNREVEISGWVSQACSLYAEIEERQAALSNVKAKLVTLPPGQYHSASGKRVTIVGASTAIKPGEAQATAARSLAGSVAKHLFTRQIVWKPVAGLREVARALLTPKKAEKLIALCEVPTAAQVRF